MLPNIDYKFKIPLYFTQLKIIKIRKTDFFFEFPRISQSLKIYAAVLRTFKIIPCNMSPNLTTTDTLRGDLKRNSSYIRS